MNFTKKIDKVGVFTNRMWGRTVDFHESTKPGADFWSSLPARTCTELQTLDPSSGRVEFCNLLHFNWGPQADIPNHISGVNVWFQTLPRFYHTNAFCRGRSLGIIVSISYITIKSAVEEFFASSSPVLSCRYVFSFCAPISDLKIETNNYTSLGTIYHSYQSFS